VHGKGAEASRCQQAPVAIDSGHMYMPAEMQTLLVCWQQDCNCRHEYVAVDRSSSVCWQV